MTRVRCAIYTRKSSEEGLEQDFNSLDAQYEACAAYVLSQASEGWTALPDRYDDGGISGGTLERPALQRLLADIAADKVDVVVVYKVDRLTRSLLDFSKLVEALDKAGASFVSVTQSFNTTTSMGRLTLNMLLSFAQFEREVTAERIRDKIAASKAKGMWMGGVPPIGYLPDGRTLKIDENNAAIVRDLFEHYLRIGNVRQLAAALTKDGIRVPVRTRANGAAFGGGSFMRGQLYALLKNPIYIGEVSHRDVRHPGLHPPIIDRDLWERVQAQLAASVQGVRTKNAASTSDALKVVSESGTPFVPTHTIKSGRRYRYYVERDLQFGGRANAPTGLRIPMRALHLAVAARIGDALADPLALFDCDNLVRGDGLSIALANAEALKAKVLLRDGSGAISLVEQVVVERQGFAITLAQEKLAAVLDIPIEMIGTKTLTIDASLARAGRAMRLVQRDGVQIGPSETNAVNAKLIARGRQWWKRVSDGATTVSQIATEDGVTRSYVARVMRTAFLAPDIVTAIVDGRAGTIDRRRLIETDAVDLSWAEQRQVFSTGPTKHAPADAHKCY